MTMQQVSIRPISSSKSASSNELAKVSALITKFEKKKAWIICKQLLLRYGRRLGFALAIPISLLRGGVVKSYTLSAIGLFVVFASLALALIGVLFMSILILQKWNTSFPSSAIQRWILEKKDESDTRTIIGVLGLLPIEDDDEAKRILDDFFLSSLSSSAADSSQSKYYSGLASLQVLYFDPGSTDLWDALLPTSSLSASSPSSPLSILNDWCKKQQLQWMWLGLWQTHWNALSKLTMHRTVNQNSTSNDSDQRKENEEKKSQKIMTFQQQLALHGFHFCQREENPLEQIQVGSPSSSHSLLERLRLGLEADNKVLYFIRAVR